MYSMQKSVYMYVWMYTYIFSLCVGILTCSKGMRKFSELETVKLFAVKRLATSCVKTWKWTNSGGIFVFVKRKLSKESSASLDVASVVIAGHFIFKQSLIVCHTFLTMAATMLLIFEWHIHMYIDIIYVCLYVYLWLTCVE